jgi:hypothetical protein
MEQVKSWGYGEEIDSNLFDLIASVERSAENRGRNEWTHEILANQLAKARAEERKRMVEIIELLPLGTFKSPLFAKTTIIDRLTNEPE